ncbi:lipase member H-like [Nelusetta ayraudi]|uniref:lipase member H-like n=1 Tax=Nelusetta ayraudi TaxID=303726 RepID=UPI003F6F9A8C
MLLWQCLTPLLLFIYLQVCKAQECDEFTDLNLGHAFIGTDVDVRLLLYTRENVSCGHFMSHTNLSAQTQFNASRTTTFLVHGYRPTGSPPGWLQNIIEQLLARKDMNLIIVDWNYGAANVNYLKAVENTHKTADNLTAFVKMIQKHGISPSSIHMIGVSLGAHISGFVGASMNGSIGRITGLDAAGPMFTGKPADERLDHTDAQFVDVLHTDIDALGFRAPIGHIDFYANGGTDQPGCPKVIFAGGSYFKCDHQRSVFLYLESLKQTCVSRAFPCSSYQDFLDGSCVDCSQFGAAGCPAVGYDAVEWKDALLKLGQTKSYFSTNSASPFCTTNYKVDLLIWNKEMRWGYITVKLRKGENVAVASIEHSATKFQRFTETKLFAQFDKDIRSAVSMSLKFTTGNAFKPKYKLRVLRVRLTPVNSTEKPLCRYDLILEESKEVTFKPIPCEESDF